MDFSRIARINRKKDTLINVQKGCGTIKQYTDKLGIPWSTGNHWKNNPESESCYGMWLLHEMMFGAPMESFTLSPFDILLTLHFRKHYKRITPVTFEFKVKNVVVPKKPFYQGKLSHHAIVMATDCSLVTGSSAFKIKEAAQAAEVLALVIDRKSILIDKRPLKDINPYPFSITERFVIYLDLKHYAHSHFLSPDEISIQIKIPKDLIELLELQDERFLEQVSQLIQHGTPETIRAFDQGQITIEAALQTLKSLELRT
ncbi:MAG: hypothetical protein KBD23_06005 [Gammaproteobacteria bacterium]|nr:hypothetical protein [Gammaproteobacteria bacterium]